MSIGAVSAVTLLTGLLVAPAAEAAGIDAFRVVDTAQSAPGRASIVAQNVYETLGAPQVEAVAELLAPLLLEAEKPWEELDCTHYDEDGECDGWSGCTKENRYGTCVQKTECAGDEAVRACTVSERSCSWWAPCTPWHDVSYMCYYKGTDGKWHESGVD